IVCPIRCSSPQLSDHSWLPTRTLHGCLTGACCRDLADVLKARESLTELDLGYNDLGNAGVRLLCEGLKHPTCKLQKLDLWDCELTGACCGDLANVLSSNQSLTELKLCSNSLGNAGVRLLCKRLTHPNCKLQQLGERGCRAGTPVKTALTNPVHSVIPLLCVSLSGCRLRDCELTGACCGDLAAVLSTSQSLTELKLSGNSLGNAGVQLLCKGLKHPNCKMQRLDLRDCELTSACCGDLANVLRTSQTLTELKLSGNNLDSGVRLLCEGLTHPNCKLETLVLHYCGLTTACCEDLSSVLSTSRTLTFLGLGANSLEDSGVQWLCEGLKHPNCKLHTLGMWDCGLSAAGGWDLSSVLFINQTLTELDLEYNELGDSRVQLLCEVLKYPACKLQKLALVRACFHQSVLGSLYIYF
uniref:Uncharacterized protein n=1 Tax=Chrysemys picta bellii TaxID=8478 RepID=A0A8C3F9A6_CHRPI